MEIIPKNLPKEITDKYSILDNTFIGKDKGIMKKLRYINLGNQTGNDLIATMDLPIFMSFDGVIAIGGTITDNHLSIGTNRKIDDYFIGNKDDFTFSRYTNQGGLMYCKGMFLYRFLFDETYSNKELSKSIAANLRKTLKQYNVIEDQKISFEGAYLCLNGDKFAGIGRVRFKNCRALYLCVNNGKIPIEEMKAMYKNKKFDHITDINQCNLPNKFYSDVIKNFALRWDLEIENSVFSDSENEKIKGLKKVHSSLEWIDKAERSDL